MSEDNLPRTPRGQVEEWAIEWIDDAAKRIAAGFSSQPEYFQAAMLVAPNQNNKSIIARMSYILSEALFAERQRRYFEGDKDNEQRTIF
jgi:hypothetical protein